ncbi:hypothetical protein HYW76_04040 [Candidatus Pacearchaeota archaeon]|nr:hypothetical protein [Candidatus Pacearchaeota archaeon]
MKIIEFLGMSRAGKSTQQKILLDIFQKEGYSSVPFVRPQISFKQTGSAENFHRMFFNEMKKAYEEGNQMGIDYLLYDRGFHDRMGMLIKDTSSGIISPSFSFSLAKELGIYTPKVDYPMLFLVSPKISYVRWAQQIREGGDNSVLCEGLEPKENIAALKESYALYAALKKRYPYLIEINAELPREAVTFQLIRVLESKRENNINGGGQSILCTR